MAGWNDREDYVKQMRILYYEISSTAVGIYMLKTIFSGVRRESLWVMLLDRVKGFDVSPVMGSLMSLTQTKSYIRTDVINASQREHRPPFQI